MRYLIDLHNDCATVLPRFEETLAALTTVTVTCAIWTTRLTERAFFGAKARVLRVGAQFSVEDCGLFAPKESLWRAALTEANAVTLTWNGDNVYAGGAYGSGGLTAAGADLIGWCNAHGIAVDLAHLNRRSFDAALRLAARPLVSHTALDALYPHPRNLTDAQIGDLIACGGVVGLSLVADFYGTDDADALLRAIDRFCGRFGALNLCIGTDFCGTDRTLGATAPNRYEILVKQLDKLGGMGYNDSVLDGICFRNALPYTRVRLPRAISAKEDQPCANFTKTP